MAASYVFGVVAADVTAELPGIDPTNIASSGEPLNTTDIGTWIDEYAARFNSVLLKSGITPSASMDADAHEVCVIGIKAAVVAKCALVLGLPAEIYASAQDRYRESYTEISNRPQQLGDAYSDGLTIAVDSLDPFNDAARKNTINSDVPVDEWF